MLVTHRDEAPAQMANTDHKDEQGLSTMEETSRSREASTEPRRGSGSMLDQVAAQVGPPVLARKIQRRAVQRKAAEGFTRFVPSSASELTDYFGKMATNREHLRSARVNLDNHHFEVGWDWVARQQFPSVFIPLKRSKAPEARKLVDTMRLMEGSSPSDGLVAELFALIDPAGQ